MTPPGKDKRSNIPSISVVLLASGFGKRYGGNKLLEDFRGKRLFTYAVRQALESGADRIAVATRYSEIKQYIENCPSDIPVRVLWNEHPEKGISESLRLGLQAEKEADGCCFMVCDQPLLEAETIHRLFQRFRENPDKIYACSDGRRRGNPVVFPRRFFGELLSIEGDQGGKQVMKKHPGEVCEVSVLRQEELYDIDSALDKSRLETSFSDGGQDGYFDK